MHDPALIEALASGLRPRDRPLLSDWMDANIVLERGGVLVPWETSRTPYIRAIAEDLSVDSPTEEVVVMKPSQTGLSELAIGFHCYMADVAPCNMIMVQPDLEVAARFKQLRIDTVIKTSPRLAALFPEKKSRDSSNSQSLVTFPGGAWLILGANSPASVASTPAPIVVIDELDRSAATVGSGVRAEGDLYGLLKARTVTFRESFPLRKLLRISSPGDKATSRIEPAWEDSSRGRFNVACSECGALAPHLMSRLWWPRKGDPYTARYRCQICDQLRDERVKDEMLARGEWVMEREHPVHGYKLVGCDSPFLRWGDMAAERERVKGNPNKLRVYVNTVEGETYDSNAEAKVDVALLKLLAFDLKRDEEGKPIIPRGVGILTTGSDTQPSRLETSLRGWGKREEQWMIDHTIHPGDASGRAVWDDLDEYLNTSWVNTSGIEMRVQASCVDTAGQNTIPAYNFVRGKQSRRVWGTVGRSGQGKRLWPRRPSQSNLGKVDLYTVGIDGAKSQLYARLKASIEQVQQHGTRGGPGFVHIAAHLCRDQDNGEPSDYLQQLVAEVTIIKLTKSGPIITWDLPAHTRNEALDCDVLCQAAFAGWRALRKNIDQHVARFNPEGMATPPPDPKGVSFKKETSSDLNETPLSESETTPTPARPVYRVPVPVRSRMKRKRVGGFMDPD